MLEDLTKRQYDNPVDAKKGEAELREHKRQESELAKLLREIKGQMDVEVEEEGGGFGGSKDIKEETSRGSSQKIDFKKTKPFNPDRDSRIPYLGLPNYKMNEI